jgi:hypothetical protein
LDRSDGTSLRRHIDGTSFNWMYDEGTAVVEIDSQIPKTPNSFRGQLGAIPNLCLRKGGFKLMLPRSSTSSCPDMMYDLDRDPYVPLPFLPLPPPPPPLRLCSLLGCESCLMGCLLNA